MARETKKNSSKRKRESSDHVDSDDSGHNTTKPADSKPDTQDILSLVPVLQDGARDYNAITNINDLRKVATAIGCNYSKRRHGTSKEAVIKHMQAFDEQNGRAIVDYFSGGRVLPKSKTGPAKSAKKKISKLDVKPVNAVAFDILANFVKQQSVKATTHLSKPRVGLSQDEHAALEALIDGVNDAYFAAVINRDKHRLEMSTGGGLVAVPEVMARLQDVITRGHVPRFTDDSDHLCGVRALIESLNFTRSAIAEENGEEPPRMLPTDGHTLRGLLFEQEDTSSDRFMPHLGRSGVPTQNFRDWIDRRLSPIGAANPSLRAEIERDMLHYENLNIHQLEALLDILQSIFPDYHDRQFVIGVVTAQHLDSQGEVIHATAHVVRNEDTRAIVVWLWNNGISLANNPGLSARDTRIGHWQSLGPPNDAEGVQIAAQWGVKSKISGTNGDPPPSRHPSQVVLDHWTVIDDVESDDDRTEKGKGNENNTKEPVPRLWTRYSCKYCETKTFGPDMEGPMWNHTMAQHMENISGYRYMTGELVHATDYVEAYDINEDEALHGELEHQLELEVLSKRVQQKAFQRDIQCIPCAAATKDATKYAKRQCNGENPCNICEKQGRDCHYPDYVQHAKFGFINVKDLDPTTFIADEDDPIYKEDIPGQTTDVPKKPYVFVVVSGRLSSGTIHAQQLLLNSYPAVYTKYLMFMAVNPEFRPANAPATRPLYLSFARKGSLTIPTRLGHLAGQGWGPDGGLVFLQAFIREFDEENLLRPANPNLPVEIHFLLRGHAGFGVDIKAWGTVTSGFLGHVIAYDRREAAAGRPLNPPLAERIFIVVSAEPHVVNGGAHWSLQPGTNYSRAPHRYYLPGNGKCYGKWKLTSLVARAVWLAQEESRVYLNQPHQPWVTMDPLWDDPVRNDVLLRAWHDEWLYRENQLDDNNTVPRHNDIHARSNGRNRV